MSYRTRVLLLGALIALPLLVLSILSAVRYQMDQEQAVQNEQLAVARAVAVAAEGFLDADSAAVRAITALPAVRNFEQTDAAELERAMQPAFDAFPQVETLGLIGPDGWNVRSLTRHVPVPPRSVQVTDREYFQTAMRTGQIVVSPAVLSRVRPGVPVVAVAVPILDPAGSGDTSVRGVLVGTLALAELQEELRSVLPDPQLNVLLVDRDGQLIVGPGIDPAADRELLSLRGRSDVDAALAGQSGSRRIAGPAGGDLLVSYAPVPDVGWGVLVQQPAANALAPARAEAIRSVGFVLLALALTLVLAWFLGGRLARSYQQLEAARREAEYGRERSSFLAESSRQLATTLDPQATLQFTAQLAVPVLADWCIVDLVTEEEGVSRRLAVAHADPAHEDLAKALRESYPADLAAASGVGRVIREGKAVLAPEVTAEGLAAAVQDSDHLCILQAIHPRSALIVPLRGRHGILGAVTFLMTTSGRRYGPDDQAVAQDLADRAALAVENAQLYEEVQNALRIRDEFLAAASHDLRNPLASIVMQAQLLRRRATRGTDISRDQLIESADRLESVAARAGDLVDELLDIARLQLGGPLDLQRADVDLTRLVEDTVDVVRATSDRHTFRIDGPPEPLIGRWDARRLRRILDNLLSNAVKFSPQGGDVVVMLRRDAGPAGDVAVLSVRDNGIGIPADDLPRLFERFRRAGNTAGRIAGAGVGLVNVRHLVESHGGTIQIESVEGEGTTVLITLPVAGADGAGATPIAPLAADGVVAD